MIRFTWMQFRNQALVALGGLAIVAIVLGLTGPSLVHLYDTSGIATCGAHGDCSQISNGLLSHDRLLQDLGTVLLVVPALIGLFWGAPLVAREFETGTFRLVWTQSITRTRWVAIKMAVLGLGSVAVAGLFSLMVTWWSSPLDRANHHEQLIGADQRDRRHAATVAAARPSAQAVRHVDRKRSGDTQSQQPPRQGRNRYFRRAESSIAIEVA